MVLWQQVHAIDKVLRSACPPLRHCSRIHKVCKAELRDMQ